MKSFNKVLVNTLIATTTNSFLWFAITFWMYLETRSVIANAFIGAMYPIFTGLFGVYFGTYVDHHKKKSALKLSSIITLVAFTLAGIVYFFAPTSALQSVTHPLFWLFILLIMAGSMAGSLRLIAMSTLVSVLVPEKDHDKANGRVGIVNGVSFAVTSVFSGLTISLLGMGWAVGISIVLTALTLIHLSTLHFKDTDHSTQTEAHKKLDFAGALSAIREVPGLSALIFFSLLNNFLGGAFFALMDPYGLELVSVRNWGFMWGALSFCFLLGGLYVSKKGLGAHPLKRLFQANIVMWLATMLFPIQPSIVLLALGMFIYMLLVPVAEAAEQTVLQKVVPLKKQGRVFGFATMVENMASPITALAMGPIAQFITIPLMTKGIGARSIGSWFGTGTNRGIAVLFIASSFIGLIVTIVAFRSRAYRQLSEEYNA